MRATQGVGVWLALSTLTLIGVGTPPAAMATTTTPVVSNTTLSPRTALLVGESTVRVSVATHISAPDGQTRNSASNSSIDDPSRLTFPFVRLQRTQGAWYLPDLDERSLSLTSGTITDGTWRVSFDVPSTYDGAWRVTAVCTQTPDLQVQCTSPEPALTLSVDGRDYPIIKAEVSPRSPRQWPDIHLTLLTSDTHRAIEGRTLVLCTNISCDEVDPPRGLLLVTDRFGHATPNTDGLEYFGSNRAWYLAQPAQALDSNVHWQDVSVDPAVRYVVSARVSASRVQGGDPVTFTGNIRPIVAGSRITLQRWVNRQWHTMSFTRLSGAGAYSITTRPNAPGTHLYRLIKGSDRCDPFRCLLLGRTTATLTVVAH